MRIRDFKPGLPHHTLLQVGERPCIVCGKPHEEVIVRNGPDTRSSWADLEDGHPYQAEFWESIARRLGTPPFVGEDAHPDGEKVA